MRAGISILPFSGEFITLNSPPGNWISTRLKYKHTRPKFTAGPVYARIRFFAEFNRNKKKWNI
jgi:hypothetical protein